MRQTAAGRTVASEIVLPLLEERRAPRSERHGDAGAFGEIGEEASIRVVPHAAEVDLAVARAWRWRRKVCLPVWQSRRFGIGPLEVLRAEVDRRGRNRQCESCRQSKRKMSTHAPTISQRAYFPSVICMYRTRSGIGRPCSARSRWYVAARS